MNGLSENLLAYIWKFQLVETKSLKTKSGKAIQVINQGVQQPNAGPDFMGAKINIEGITLCGNIELHISTKDWLRHAHQDDAAYNTVVLHVVWEAHEERTQLPNKQFVEVLELSKYVDKKILSRYQLLLSADNSLPCSELSYSLESFAISNFLDRIAIQRLERKISEIDQLLSQTNGDWNQVVFIQLARYLGSSLNNEAMKALATSIDFKIIQKSKSDLSIIEAILFGQSGLLDREIEEDYFLQLRKEYLYQKRLHSLQPLAAEQFKFSKIRPSAFPSFRIAQLASMLFAHDFSIESLCAQENIDSIRSLFSFKEHAYWESHFDFATAQQKKHSLALGKLSIDMLLINFYCPLIFAYGKYKDDESLEERALGILEKLTAEKNSLVSAFEAITIKPINALQSQALIELKTNYCSKYRCLECTIGNAVLRN